jgi:cytochrome b
MVLALLICLAGTVATGLMAYGESGKGPLAGSVSLSAPTVRAGAGNEEFAPPRGKTEGEKSAVGELHRLLANIALGLVVLHVLGVGLASVVHRENLVASMIHGRKRGES